MSSWLNRRPMSNKIPVVPILPAKPAPILEKEQPKPNHENKVIHIAKESNARTNILLEEKKALEKASTALKPLTTDERALIAAMARAEKKKTKNSDLAKQAEKQVNVAPIMKGLPKEILKIKSQLKQNDYTIGIGLIHVDEEQKILPSNCTLFVHDNESEFAKNTCLEQLKACDYIFLITNNIPNYEDWWVSYIEDALKKGEHCVSTPNMQFLTNVCLMHCGGFNADFEKIGEGWLEYSKRASRKGLIVDDADKILYIAHDSFILHGLFIKKIYTITFFDIYKHQKKDLDAWVSIQTNNKIACIVFHNGLEEENTEFVIYLRQIASLWKTIRLFFIENRHYIEGICIVDFKKCSNIPHLEDKNIPQTYTNCMNDSPEYVYIPNKHIVSISTTIEYMIDNSIMGGFDMSIYNTKFIENNHA